jgi:hypothetical protein
MDGLAWLNVPSRYGTLHRRRGHGEHQKWRNQTLLLLGTAEGTRDRRGDGEEWSMVRMREVLVMSEQITLDELLKLVGVEKIGGKWNLRAIIGDVSGDCCGSIGGNVWGNIGGSVEGDIEGDVIGDVFGNVVGNVQRCSRPE